MFQLACPASVRPALRPTRGSGFGAVAPAVDAIEEPDDMGTGTACVTGAERAHAARAMAADAQDNVERSRGSRSKIIRVVGWRRGDRSLRWRRAGFDGERQQHLLHPPDLGRLIDVHVVGKLEYALILRGARSGEELLHHLDRALMVLNHPGE